MNPQIVYNAIRTPDGTILESCHRHQYIQYTDKKTKKLYAVDGGLDYLKRIGSDDYQELSISVKAPFEKIRECAFRVRDWQVVRIKDMSSNWLESAITYELDLREATKKGENKCYSPLWHLLLLMEEKLYRAKHEIYVEEDPIEKRKYNTKKGKSSEKKQ